jgi:hypothetical protein
MQRPFSPGRLSGAQIPRLVPGAVQTATAEAAPATACPRCRGTLADPAGLGYCPRCGFCRAVEQENARAQAAAAAPLREAANEQLTTYWQVVRALPESVWVILVATVFLLPISYLAHRSLGPDTRARYIWMGAQIALGVVSLLAAQVWAFVLVRRKERVGLRDLVFPGNLWRHAVHGLPETGGPFSLCFFGGVALLTAVLWIGRWDWLLTYDTERDIPKTVVAEESRDFRSDYKKLKEATNAELNKPAPTPTPVTQVDTRPTVQCVVIGYVPGADGQIDRLVLATLKDGTLTYAGTVSSGLGRTEATALTKKFAALTSKAPLLANLDVKAVWVRPEVFCEVHQSGANDKGHLIGPRFKAVIADE